MAITSDAAPRGRRAFLRAAGGLAASVAATAAYRAEAAAETAPPPASKSRPRDMGLWATWYDLPEEGRADYLGWLHGTYIPQLLKRPGFLWAAHYELVVKEWPATPRDNILNHTNDTSIPTGNHYILLFGGSDANVFGKPLPSEINAKLPAAGKKMLAMRIGERVNITTEAARVDGPALKEYKGGMALAPCIQIGTFNCAYQSEDEMLAWYAQSRMPAMTSLPGCIRTRKLASVSGWAKHGILYEFVSVEDRNKNFLTFEDGHPEMKAWAERFVPKLVHAPGSPNLARRIYPEI